MVKTYIIILNYNGKENVAQCIKELLKYDAKKESVHVLVVDNASSDGSEEYIREYFGEKVEIIQTHKNLGYAGGNNIGIRHAVKNGARYICIMNNDIIVKEGFLDDCIDVLKADKRAAFVAPGIANYYTNQSDNTGASISILKGKANFINKNCERNKVPQSKLICDMVEGSCFVFNVNILKKIGFIPEAYFMYYEETEWCYIAKKNGYHCVSLPFRWVYHKKRAAVKKEDGFYEYMMERNRIVFVKRNATKKEKVRFILYMMVRNMVIARQNKQAVSKYLSMQLDGLFNRKSKKYTFIYIPPNA